MKSLPEWTIVFIWFTLTLTIFYSGHLYSNDTLSKVEAARSFIKKGSFDVDVSTGAWGTTGRCGRTYPNFSFGSVLIMGPPVLCYEALSVISNKSLPKYIRSILVTGCNLVYTSLIGVLIFLLLRNLGKTLKQSFIFANITVFTTEILQYSSTGWSEPAAFLWGLLGFLILFIRKPGDPEQFSKKKWVLWAICAFVASLIRIEYITFFMFFLVIHLLHNKTQWKLYILPFVILCSVMVIHMGYNFYRFESIFNFGYFSQGAVKTTSMVAAGASSIMDVIRSFVSKGKFKTIYRTYISFGRAHWFWVSPLIALSPFVLYYREIPLLIKKIFSAACLQLLINIIAMGNNSWCWANRYLYTIFPYLLLPVFFFPLEKKNLSRIFRILCGTGLVISLFSTLVNTHYVQELLVNKYGYHKAMWEYTSHFFTAPFWLHIKLFPRQFVNTLMLIVKGGNLPPWEVLRTDCLDIWPVGLCGAGVNSFFSFGLWFVLVITTTIFVIKIVWPKILKN